MTVDLEAIFRDRSPDTSALLREGFVRQGDALIRQFPLPDELTLCVSVTEVVRFTVLDSSGEEYVLVHVENAQGGFVQEVRAACEAQLRALAERCFPAYPFRSGQAGRMIRHIREACGVSPEFPWERYPGNCIFRREDSGKWFAALLTVPREKLGLSGQDSIAVLNLKAEPAKVLELIGQPGFHPAWHMNKKHWVSVRMDGTAADTLICALIDESYAAVSK